jgi:GTPase involved in cell partitioning and DNA repair
VKSVVGIGPGALDANPASPPGPRRFDVARADRGTAGEAIFRQQTKRAPHAFQSGNTKATRATPMRRDCITEISAVGRCSRR